MRIEFARRDNPWLLFVIVRAVLLSLLLQVPPVFFLLVTKFRTKLFVCRDVRKMGMAMIQGPRKWIGRYRGKFDEECYHFQYADVRSEVGSGQFSSAFQHYHSGNAGIASVLREAIKAQALRLVLVLLGRT
jgi:hypothetical protein